MLKFSFFLQFIPCSQVFLGLISTYFYSWIPTGTLSVSIPFRLIIAWLSFPQATRFLLTFETPQQPLLPQYHLHLRNLACESTSVALRYFSSSKLTSNFIRGRSQGKKLQFFNFDALCPCQVTVKSHFTTRCGCPYSCNLYLQSRSSSTPSMAMLVHTVCSCRVSILLPLKCSSNTRPYL